MCEVRRVVHRDGPRDFSVSLTPSRVWETVHASAKGRDDFQPVLLGFIDGGQMFHVEVRRGNSLGKGVEEKLVPEVRDVECPAAFDQPVQGSIDPFDEVRAASCRFRCQVASSRRLRSMPTHWANRCR